MRGRGALQRAGCLALPRGLRATAERPEPEIAERAEATQVEVELAERDHHRRHRAPSKLVSQPRQQLARTRSRFGKAWRERPAPCRTCPPGYADPTDLHRDLNAPMPACTCTCTAQDQVCTSTVRLYSDLACASECANASVQVCSAESGPNCGSRGSIKPEAATISGGSCVAAVSPRVEATWRYNARLCQPTGACDDPNQVCAPSPRSPYISQRCGDACDSGGPRATAVPPEFPNSNKPFYQTFTDDRGCTDCGCGAL